MSRFNRFAQSLASGYVLLGANILYTLASVPLALKYLGNAEFGLWALATKIGGFIALLDFGLGGSVARILIDHKDDRQSGAYGGIIKTGVLVGVVQGSLVLLCGIVLAFLMGPWLQIHPRLQPSLKWLMIGQCALLAFSFATRTLSHLLTAHQRYDIQNYAQSILLGVGLAVMWFGFEHGQGVFSILWAQACSVVPLVAVCWVGCMRLNLLPRPGEWGKLTWPQFKAVFTFGSDIFIFAVGAMLITASQTVLLTRLIGLEAVAVWTVSTRVYDVLVLIIYRIFDYSCPVLAEMIVRGEKALLAVRFRQIVILSTSLSLAAGTVFALCNSAFVKLWTSGRFESPRLMASDIKEPQLLVNRLRQQHDAPARYLWEQFTPAAQSEVPKLADDEESTSELQEVLAAEFNRILQGKLFSTATNFAGMAYSKEMQQTPPYPDNKLASTWFNRHLLEDAFPREIADSRKARWSSWNDLLLGLWLILSVSVHAHTGLVGQTKQFRFMRYLFFVEGLAFVGLTVAVHRFGGITAMLLTSIACTLAFSFPYGLRRTRAYFGLSWRELARWHEGPMKFAMWVIPTGLLFWWLTKDVSAIVKLGAGGGIWGLFTAWMFLRYGLGEALRAELVQRAPAWIKSGLAHLGIS